MKSALSVKVRDSLMTVVRGMEMDKPSTKAMKGFMNAIGAQKVLVVYHEGGDNVMWAIEGSRSTTAPRFRSPMWRASAALTVTMPATGS